jgi:pimeloyl-ACP methyl ester carboxylesterase
MVSGQKKPILLFIHGYGGTGAVYFDLMKPLSQHFNAIFIDIIGMGSSTREPYNA